MPIYEYRCQQGHTFEVMQRMSDEPVASCQTCSAPVQRVFHPVAVHFKGSGFYNTDYGKRKGQRDRGDEDAAGSDSTTTSDSTAKPDATAAKADPASAKSDPSSAKSDPAPANRDAA